MLNELNIEGFFNIFHVIPVKQWIQFKKVMERIYEGQSKIEEDFIYIIILIYKSFWCR